jgi:hypothetical protein
LFAGNGLGSLVLSYEGIKTQRRRKGRAGFSETAADHGAKGAWDGTTNHTNHTNKEEGAAGCGLGCRDASTEPRGPSAQQAGTDRNVRATVCGS